MLSHYCSHPIMICLGYGCNSSRAAEGACTSRVAASGHGLQAHVLHVVVLRCKRTVPVLGQVSFTGSTEVGALVGAAAAKNIKPCTLELGGKSAAIVWKDVDIDQVHVPLCCAHLPRLTSCPVAQVVLHDLIAQAAGVAPAVQVVQEAHNALFFNHGQCCAAGAPVASLGAAEANHAACFGLFDNKLPHCAVTDGQTCSSAPALRHADVIIDMFCSSVVGALSQAPGRSCTRTYTTSSWKRRRSWRPTRSWATRCRRAASRARRRVVLPTGPLHIAPDRDLNFGTHGVYPFRNAGTWRDGGPLPIVVWWFSCSPLHPSKQYGCNSTLQRDMLASHAQVDEEQFKKIMSYIDQGKSEGAKLNCGGKRKGNKGFYVEPTVFSEVPSRAGSGVLRGGMLCWPMQLAAISAITCLHNRSKLIN